MLSPGLQGLQLNGDFLTPPSRPGFDSDFGAFELPHLGGFIDLPGSARFRAFNKPAAAEKVTDPQQLLAIEMAFQASDTAGFLGRADISVTCGSMNLDSNLLRLGLMLCF